MSLEINKVHNMDCLTGLKQIPKNTIDCIVTSPPYYALRDYQINSQIWDGNPDCEHEWNDNSYVRNTDKTAGKKK